MTQPATTSTGGGHQVLATAAITLALIALEQSAQQQINQAISTAADAIAKAAIVVASAAPGTLLTGIALISIPALHTALTTNLDTARQRVSDAVTAGYQAALSTAQVHTLADLAQHGYQPDTMPFSDQSLDTALRDITTMFGHAQTDIQNRIIAAFNPQDTLAERILKLQAAVTAAETTLTGRATKTVTTAIQRAATDTQQALYSDFQTHSPQILGKRWVTTSNDPCGMCRALNGTIVGVNAEFNARATTTAKDLRPVWRNMAGPPRHPNCRCKLELVTF